MTSIVVSYANLTVVLIDTPVIYRPEHRDGDRDRDELNTDIKTLSRTTKPKLSNKCRVESSEPSVRVGSEGRDSSHSAVHRFCVGLELTPNPRQIS